MPPAFRSTGIAAASAPILRHLVRSHHSDTWPPARAASCTRSDSLYIGRRKGGGKNGGRRIYSNRKQRCPSLSAPEFGTVSISTSGATVTYACNKGFKLKGHSRRICCGGRWGQFAPTCKCTSIIHGAL